MINRPVDSKSIFYVSNLLGDKVLEMSFDHFSQDEIYQINTSSLPKVYIHTYYFSRFNISDKICKELIGYLKTEFININQILKLPQSSKPSEVFYLNFGLLFY